LTTLQVDLLGREIGDRLAGADAGVADQHVEAPEAIAVRAHDLLHERLVGQVAADGVDVEAVGAQAATASSSFSGRRAATVRP
jgi:2-keto-3-deoxy-galactonokinase